MPQPLTSQELELAVQIYHYFDVKTVQLAKTQQRSCCVAAEMVCVTRWLLSHVLPNLKGASYKMDVFAPETPIVSLRSPSPVWPPDLSKWTNPLSPLDLSTSLHSLATCGWDVHGLACGTELTFALLT